MHLAAFLLHRVRCVTHQSCVSQMIHSQGKHTLIHSGLTDRSTDQMMSKVNRFSKPDWYLHMGKTVNLHC